MSIKNNNKAGKLFVISAPSGAGKTTLTKEAIKRIQKENFDISRVITYTTRKPRENEVNGKDYYFLSEEEFKQKLKNGFFIETTKYNGANYGSPADLSQELELGKSLVIITDIDGAKAYSKLYKNAVLIWISAPNIEELKRRLLQRNTDSHTQIMNRLQLAEEEEKEARKPRLFKYHVTNDIFEKTVAELILIFKDELS